jgi:hypothetical protein
VADDYALYLPDTRAEAGLDLAMLDDFLASVAAAGSPNCPTPLRTLTASASLLDA